MTALAPLPVAPTTTRSRARWVIAGVALVALAAFAVWAKGRIDGLDRATQATNPIIRWEYVFERPQTPELLKERVIEHLQLTVIPMVIGCISASFATASATNRSLIRFCIGCNTAFAAKSANGIA